MTDNRFYLANQLIQPIQPSGVNRSRPTQSNTAVSGGFEQALNQAIGGVKFSQHAMQRLQTRNINMTPAQMDQLKGAVDKAAQKGIIHKNNASRHKARLATRIKAAEAAAASGAKPAAAPASRATR